MTHILQQFKAHSHQFAPHPSNHSNKSPAPFSSRMQPPIQNNPHLPHPHLPHTNPINYFAVDPGQRRQEVEIICLDLLRRFQQACRLEYLKNIFEKLF